MTDSELQKIIKEVTAQVLDAKASASSPAASGAEKILVVGDTAKVPAQMGANAVLCGLECYECDRYIAPYSKVVITELSLIQLCDIANGRPSDPACCAVIQALLNGKTVMLLESGLPHRAFAGKGSTALYAKLESYVRTLSGFGVKMMTETRMYRPAEVPVKPAKFQKPSEAAPRGNTVRNYGSVITEEIALKLVKEDSDTVVLPHGAIITPSARDVFTKMRINVTKG